ncbi:MAG: S9 family peptidase, partial [bacterium]
MKKLMIFVCLCAVLIPLCVFAAPKNSDNVLKPIDVFDLELASDPQISPDGKKIVYVRNFFDIMSDRRHSNLWIINLDGTEHRPLTSGNNNYSSPRWSPDGSKLLYVAKVDGANQIYMRWMDTGQSAKLTNLTKSPNGLVWSPDGKWLAFSMFVKAATEPFAKMPAKPEGAEWAKPAKVIQKLQYRADGQGYLEDGYTHLFVLPAEGGTPRQVTSGNFNHGGSPVWSRDGKSLVFSANRHDGWEYDPLNSEIYEVSLTDGDIKALTDRKGPDTNPAISPAGRQIAYLGFDDRLQGYQVTRLYVMNRDGSGSHLVSKEFDRDVGRPTWSRDGKNIFFQYDDKGNTKVGYTSLTGTVQTLVGNVGGLSLGRPYAGGMYSVAGNNWVAFTHSRPDHPADVAIAQRGSSHSLRLTRLNDDLLAHKQLGEVEEIWYESSYDQRKIQGWIVKPPDFQEGKKYPLLLEIHGGPFANYGDRFAAEIQLYAAAGYVVLYANPRGST